MRARVVLVNSEAMFREGSAGRARWDKALPLLLGGEPVPPEGHLENWCPDHGHSVVVEQGPHRHRGRPAPAQGEGVIMDYVTEKAAELLLEDIHPSTLPALAALFHLPDPPPSPGQVIAMAEIFGCPPTPLLILTGWLPKLDGSLPVAGPRTHRRSTLYQRDGDPGWGVYDDTDPAQVAALSLRYVLLGEGFPAVAVGRVVGTTTRLQT